MFPDVVPNLSNDRKLVMNPYSHDDIETPLYRRELKNAIEDVERLTKIQKKRLISDEEIGNKEFKIEIITAAATATAIFVFVERFERVEYETVRYYGASLISVKNISHPAIKTNTTNYSVRNLYKDLYESLGLTAIDRPKFEDCITSVSDGRPISAL